LTFEDLCSLQLQGTRKGTIHGNVLGTKDQVINKLGHFSITYILLEGYWKKRGSCFSEDFIGISGAINEFFFGIIFTLFGQLPFSFFYDLDLEGH